MKKVIKGLILASLLLGNTQLSADGVSYKSGVYAGALFGYSRMQTDFKSSYDVGGAGPAFSGREAPKAFQGNVTGSLFLGYRYLIQSIFLGVDCDLALYNNSTSKDYSFSTPGAPTPFGARLQRHFSVTPSAVMGVTFLDNWNAFLKLGLGISQFTLKVLNLTAPARHYTKTKTLFGFVPTLGVEYAVTQAISVLGSVTYEWYPSIKRSVSGDELLPGVGAAGWTVEHGVSVKPRVFSVRMGVLFKV